MTKKKHVVRLDTAIVPPVFDEKKGLPAVPGASRGVTDRIRQRKDLKRALGDLARQTELIDTIIDSTPGIFYVVDFDGNFQRWNDNLEQVTGLSHEELASTNALALFEGADQQRVATAIQETARFGQATAEAGILHKSGWRTPHLLSGRKVRLGAADLLVGMGIDITNRLQQERSLNERVKELRCLFDISAAVGSDTTIPALLEQSVALIPLGWQCPDATRARIEFDELAYGDDDLQGDSPAKSHFMSAEIRTKGQRRGRVLVYSTGDGLQDSQVPFLDEEQDLLATIARMISEAIERRENADLFMSLLQRTPLPMCLVNENEELVFPNDRFGAIFGYTPEDIPTLAEWWQLAYPDEEYRTRVIDTWNEVVNKAAAKGTDIEPIEYRITCKDGTVKIMEVSGVAIGKSFLATFVDQTSRREAEAILENHRDRLEAEVETRTAELSARTRELELANQELNAFAYSVSHDLRAPLRSITGFTHALLEDYGELLDTEGKDYLERCSSAARRMGRLIDDLLTLSRITRTEVRPELVDFSGMADELAEELHAEKSTWGGDIVVQRAIKLIADRRLLQHALRNLLDNARKFSAKRPHPKVVVGREVRDGEEVVFVRDNGAGFDMTYAENLFTPFHRLHKETEFAGTGIGLSIVQRIVRMHGGCIRAESSPDKGTTFFFTLKPDATPTEEVS